MKKKAIDSILSFINRYRAVTFGALRMNIPHISDETIFSDTTRLCKRRLISYEKKKRDIDSTMYFPRPLTASTQIQCLIISRSHIKRR